MKARGVILFAAGVSFGWWIAGTPVASSAIGTWQASLAGGRTPDRVSGSSLVAGLPREIGGQVQVSADQLKKLLDAESSPVARAENFTGDEDDAHLDPLAKWLGMDAGSREQLGRVLHDASAARFAWEKTNVSVSIPEAGKWILKIPGDDGTASAKLHGDLKAAFGEEQAEAIILSADLDHFFGLPDDLERAKDSTGKIEIEAAKFADGPIKEQQDGLYFRVAGPGGTMVCIGASYGQSSLRRVKHLLPPYAQIRDAARVVPYPTVIPEGDTFINPFGSLDGKAPGLLPGPSK